MTPPPYPATEFANYVVQTKNGKHYASRKAANGKFRWVREEDRSKDDDHLLPKPLPAHEHPIRAHNKRKVKTTRPSTKRTKRRRVSSRQPKSDYYVPFVGLPAAHNAPAPAPPPMTIAARNAPAPAPPPMTIAARNAPAPAPPLMTLAARNAPAPAPPPMTISAHNAPAPAPPLMTLAARNAPAPAPPPMTIAAHNAPAPAPPLRLTNTKSLDHQQQLDIARRLARSIENRRRNHHPYYRGMAARAA